MAKKTTPTGLQPILERQTVQDQVYAQLREALISAAFEAGETFTISALAERFQVSHMPVREALRRLAAESALRISASGTAFVPELSIIELEDITRARVILEGATAALAFPRLDAGDLRILRDIIDRHDASGRDGDTIAMTAANRQFHFHIYAAALSPVLQSQIENLWLRSGPYVRVLTQRRGDLVKIGDGDSFAPHHEAALSALSTGDATGFRAAIEADIHSSDRLLHELIAMGPSVSR